MMGKVYGLLGFTLVSVTVPKSDATGTCQYLLRESFREGELRSKRNALLINILCQRVPTATIFEHRERESLVSVNINSRKKITTVRFAMRAERHVMIPEPPALDRQLISDK